MNYCEPHSCGEPHFVVATFLNFKSTTIKKETRKSVCVRERERDRERERENHMRLKINKNLVPAKNNDVKTKKKH